MYEITQQNGHKLQFVFFLRKLIVLMELQLFLGVHFPRTQFRKKILGLEVSERAEGIKKDQGRICFSAVIFETLRYKFPISKFFK